MNFLIKHDFKEVINMNIGNNISLLRKSRNLTQEELAAALGVSAQAVSKWENNSSCPDVSLLTVIADYFGVTVDALLRSGAEEITRADPPSTDDNVAAVRGGKRNVSIKVTQPNGKETNVKVPFGVVKMGLGVGNVFGLQRDVADKIGALLDDPAAADILSVDGENGEHVTISIE
mgnify:CR=1 FL=1